MELSSILGFILGFGFTIISIVLAATGDIGKVLSFIDMPSVMIVFGGCFATLLISNPVAATLNGLKAIGIIFKPPHYDPAAAVTKIIELANLARKEGILALEESTHGMDDPFLQKGVMLIVDGTDPELVRNILETEMAYIEGRHRQTFNIWETLAAMGPAWGMIGTIIGLIIMLGDLSDPDSIGPSMAVALITTFYGSMVANLVATPVLNKLKFFSSAEMLMKEVLTEGMLSIQAGENPRIIEEKLKSFLAPRIRTEARDETGGGRRIEDDE